MAKKSGQEKKAGGAQPAASGKKTEVGPGAAGPGGRKQGKQAPEARAEVEKLRLLEGPGFKWLGRWWMIIVTVLALVQFLGVVDRFVYFQGGDNAEYFSLAQSLVSGRGYTNINTYPAEPHTKYPPVFPLLLAAVMIALGENALVMKVLIALCAGAMVGAAAWLWSEREDQLLAALAAVLAATVPFTLTYSIRLLSEIPFTALAMLGLLFTERTLRREKMKITALLRRPELALASLFLVLAYFTRSAGIALVPAVAAAVLLRRPVKKRLRENLVLAGALLGPLVVAAGAWTLRCRLATHGQGKSYLREFFIKDPYNLDSPIIGFSEFLGRFRTGGRWYLDDLGATLWPFSDRLDKGRLIYLGTMIALVCLIGLVRSIRERRGAPEFYTIAYGLLIVTWTFLERRFLIPIFPLLAYYLLKGVEGLIRAAARAWPPLGRPAASRAAIALIAVVMLSSNLPANVKYLVHAREVRQLTGVEVNPWFRIIAFNQGMDRMLRLAMYIRTHSGPEAVVFARKPTLVALASGRPAVGGPFSADPAEFVANLERKKITHVVIDEVYQQIGEYFLPAIKANPGRFKIVYQIPGTRSAVYQFLPQPGSSP